MTVKITDREFTYSKFMRLIKILYPDGKIDGLHLFEVKITNIPHKLTVASYGYIDKPDTFMGYPIRNGHIESCAFLRGKS